MTTLNDTLNTINADLTAATEKAEGVRTEAVNKANAKFAEAEAKAKGVANKALAEAAETHFANGGTLDDFAEAYGKSAVTTRNHLKALDVDVPAGKKGAKSNYSEDEQEAIAKAWYEADKRGRLTLALDKDVTEATMRNWAIKLGVFEPVKREVKAEAEATA